MSDAWSRPTDERASTPPDQVLEIELDGPGIESSAAGGPPEQPEPNWRKVVAISSIAGVVLGVIVAASIVTSGDDDPDGGARPGVEESRAAPAITAPDTLPPVVASTMAPPTSAPIVAGTVAPEVPAVVSGPPDLPLELPSYPAATMPADILDDFVLDGALIAEDPADRVEIEVTTESRLGAMTAVIEYDPANHRYLATFDQRGLMQRLLVDVDEEILYYTDLEREGGRWDVIAGSNAAESAAETYRALLLSPVRPQTLESAAINAQEGVVLDSGRVARRYRVELPAVAIPEWTTGAEGPEPGTSHVLEAYVDENGRLAVVQGAVVIDGNRQLIVYRFDHNAEVTIDLPEITDIDDDE